MKLRYTERADEELDAAVAWYEAKRKGLGLEFLDSVEDALRELELNNIP